MIGEGIIVRRIRLSQTLKNSAQTKYLGLDGIFYSTPIADFFAALIISVMLFRQIRRFDPPSIDKKIL